DNKSQERRLKERGLTTEQINRRLASQYDTEEKRLTLEQQNDKDNHGRVWVFDNSDGDNQSGIESLFDEVVNDLNVK
ncbi:hypothetical protein KY317_00880, partial [Candidatus Woesearchaeota archaeon]|nr:hypothetical protein [Candidatus Woesearchaeota archaeon]